MYARLKDRVKPRGGFAHFVHLALVCLLPAIVFVLIRIRFYQLAVAVVLLSKWRMLAVRPRYWLMHIRANAVDIIVGLSIVVFMAHASILNFLIFDRAYVVSIMSLQLFWAVVYGIWLIFLKPGASVLKIGIQAGIGQLFGLMALFLGWSDAPLIGLVVLGWAICYFSARHFFTSFEEQYNSLLAHVWGYFAACLIWVLGHWLLFYGILAQPTLLLTVIGYGCATIYYLDQSDRLSTLLRRQFVFIMVAIVTVVLVFSNWGDKVI